MKRIFRLISLLLILGSFGLLAIPFLPRLVERISPTPSNLGLGDGQLNACPETPNCVNTYAAADDQEHYIPFIPFEGTVAEAQTRILATIAKMNRATVVTNEPNYIHVEFRTPTMGFIDDAEFHFGEGVEGIQFRSAARLGYGDGGVNRNRMEKFRRLFEALEE